MCVVLDFPRPSPPKVAESYSLEEAVDAIYAARGALRAVDKSILIGLVVYAVEGGRLTLDSFAAEVCVSKRTVQRSISRLVALGCLSVEPGTYVLQFPRIRSLAAAGPGDGK